MVFKATKMCKCLNNLMQTNLKLVLLTVVLRDFETFTVDICDLKIKPLLWTIRPCFFFFFFFYRIVEMYLIQ